MIRTLTHILYRFIFRIDTWLKPENMWLEYYNESFILYIYSFMYLIHQFHAPFLMYDKLMKRCARRAWNGELKKRKE